MDEQSWLLEPGLRKDFLNICRLAETGTVNWAHFKNHPAVNCIVENSTQEWADTVRQGTGILYEGMTPNEVRYHYTWLIIATLIPDYTKVSEIGGGYGGMCEAIFKHFILPHPVRYYIYDLPEVSRLQRRYIDDRIIDFDAEKVYCYETFLKDPPSHDLCIAWCSWSELSHNEKLRYISKVMVYAEHIFISSNWDYDGDLALLKQYFPNVKEYTNPYLGKIIYT